MEAIKREKDGDWNFEIVLNGIDAILQEVQNSVNLHLGEAIWDTTNGVDYRRFLTNLATNGSVADNPLTTLLTNAIATQAIKIPFVSKASIKNIKFENNNCVIEYNITIKYNGEEPNFSLTSNLST